MISDPDDPEGPRLARGWRVAEAEGRCAAQAALIAHLQANGEDTTEAEILLTVFTETVSFMRRVEANVGSPS